MTPRSDPPAPAPRPSPILGKLTALLVALAGSAFVLGFCVWGAVTAWREAARASPDSHITGHGWAALAIAVVMVLIVGAGLMQLAFYSARKGYDERAGAPED